MANPLLVSYPFSILITDARDFISPSIDGSYVGKSCVKMSSHGPVQTGFHSPHGFFFPKDARVFQGELLVQVPEESGMQIVWTTLTTREPRQHTLLLPENVSKNLSIPHSRLTLKTLNLPFKRACTQIPTPMYQSSERGTGIPYEFITEWCPVRVKG